MRRYLTLGMIAYLALLVAGGWGLFMGCFAYITVKGILPFVPTILLGGK